MRVKFVNEALEDILKPKSQEEIKSYLKKELKIRKNKISIRITSPLSKYYKEKINKLLKKYNIEKKEIGKPYVYVYEITGDLLDVFNFLNAYFGWNNEICIFHLHNNIVK